MAEAYSLSVWPSSLALESKLSRNLESHTGLVPRLSHHEWKNLKNHSSVPYINIPTEELWRSRFSWFFLDEKVSLKGITVFVGRLSGCLHTSRLTTNGVNTLTRVSFSARGFQGFC